MEDLQSRNELLEIIDNVSQAEGMNCHKIADVQKNQKGEGYLGEIFFVTLEDEKTKKRLSLILKAGFKGEKVREFVPVRMAFENECHFYSTVYPAFRKFEKSCGIENSPGLVPKIYDVSLRDHAEIVALENLKPLGFETLDKAKLLDHDHVKLIFETYGRYHAYSFALKDQHPEEFEKLGSRMHNIFGEFSKNSIFLKTYDAMVKLTKTFFTPGRDDEILRRLEKYDVNGIARVFGKSTDSSGDYCVIVHGDCWSNNMMFKYEKNGDETKLKDIRLIDWQLVRLASPVCDLSYFLYAGAPREVLDKLDEYLKIYHDALSFHIRRFGSDPEKLFPFSALKDHWKTYARYGICNAISLLKVKVTYAEEVFDLQDFGAFEDDVAVEKFMKAKYDEELYRKRIVDLYQHACEVDAL